MVNILFLDKSDFKASDGPDFKELMYMKEFHNSILTVYTKENGENVILKSRFSEEKTKDLVKRLSIDIEEYKQNLEKND